MALVASQLTFLFLKAGNAIGMVTCGFSIRSTSDPALNSVRDLTRTKWRLTRTALVSRVGAELSVAEVVSVEEMWAG